MIVFLVIALLHAAFCLFLAFTWDKISVFKGISGSGSKVSVLIPARNEARNIKALLSALERQSYDSKHFEVIVIDDNSEDDTRQIVHDFAKNSSVTIRPLKLSGYEGKKKSIEYGVSKASGDIIMCTDGDCLVPEKWVETFVSFFQLNDAKLVSGPVKMESESWFGHYQALDFSTLIGFGAATLQKGVASTCNGANMAYLKSVFQEVGGYSGNAEIPTGDDEFLLQKVHNAYPRSVHFLKSKDIIVTTKPKANAGEFVQQRIRWSSKWRYHSSNIVKGAALFAYFDFLSFLVLLAFTLLGVIPLFAALILIAIRWVSEAFYLYKTSSFFDLKFSKRYYPILSFIYPFFIFFLGFASIFGHYSWKGRRY